MENKESIYWNEHELDNELRRIKESSICEENKEHLHKYKDFMRSNGLCDLRLLRVLYPLRRMAEILDKPFYNEAQVFIFQ